MRIIAGDFGGRKFQPPAGIPARPTTDMAKGGLFNALVNRMDLEGSRTLDLFAGTGSISYELASRGAADLTVVERDNTSADFIKKTAAVLGISDRLHIVRSDVFSYLRNASGPFDFIFADPPYALENMDAVPGLVLGGNLLSPGGVFVLEHTSRNDYAHLPQFTKMKQYGTTVLSFFTAPE